MKTGANNRKPQPDSAACLLTPAHEDSQLSNEESSQTLAFALQNISSSCLSFLKISLVFPTNEMSQFYHHG